MNNPRNSSDRKRYVKYGLVGMTALGLLSGIIVFILRKKQGNILKKSSPKAILDICIQLIYFSLKVILEVI